MPTTGTLIKLFREKKGIQQKQLADRLGLSAAYLSLVEKGKRQGTVEFYKQVAREIGIPVWVLLWDEFELPIAPSSDDRRIKEKIDELIPELRSFIIKQIF